MKQEAASVAVSFWLKQIFSSGIEPSDLLRGRSGHNHAIISFTECLHELEDHDLDALVADLGSESIKETSSGTDNEIATTAMTQDPGPAAALPPPSNTAGKVLQMVN